MLQLLVPPANDLWDYANQMFVSTKECRLSLEHSLISISKWESKWHKAFLGKREKTNEEIMDYVRCMTVTPNVDPNIYYALTKENIRAINDYIQDPMTATCLPKDTHQSGIKDTPTSELIYFWMISYGIPFECQRWHLNKLLTLIRVCDQKNHPAKRMGRNEIISRNASLNKARRLAHHTKG